MYQILPFVTTIHLALPNLPMEMWVTILRFLDPSSLLTAIQTSTLWNTVAMSDPILRRIIQKELVVQRQRHAEETLNPGLLMEVTRNGPNKLFASNGAKIVRRRQLTEVQNISGFPVATKEKFKRRHNGDGEPVRKKKHMQRNAPYKPLRC